MNQFIFLLYKYAAQLALPLIFLSLLVQAMSFSLTEIDPMLPLYFLWAYQIVYLTCYVPIISLSGQGVRLDKPKTIGQLWLALLLISAIGRAVFPVILILVDYFPGIDSYSILRQVWNQAILTTIIVFLIVVVQKFFRVQASNVL